jgi:hypothetical protein
VNFRNLLGQQGIAILEERNDSFLSLHREGHLKSSYRLNGCDTHAFPNLKSQIEYGQRDQTRSNGDDADGRKNFGSLRQQVSTAPLERGVLSGES